MSNSEEYRRQRATNAQLDKYGKNRRRLWNEYPAVQERLRYLCEALFFGDYHEMALAIGVCYRQLYRILDGHSRLSVRMAGQLVVRLGVRADWLLCGAGTVFPVPDHVEYFQYLPRINSCYYTPNLNEQVAGTNFLPTVPEDKPETNFDTTDFGHAARSIFIARSHQKPVLFFLASDAFTVSTTPSWQPFFVQRYANILMLTLSGACLDLAGSAQKTPVDINTLAMTAAVDGVSYGETLCRYGFPTPEARVKSVAAAAFGSGAPVLISAEIGEITNHTNPSLRPPELGAAIGAAAYVDLLAFTQYVPNFLGEPGGVIVACGNIDRIVTTFLARLESLQLTRTDNANFVFVLFAPRTASTHDLETAIHNAGGRVIYLTYPTVASITQLLHSCNDAYAGKRNHT